MPRLRVGISGWRYGPWRGTFYPEDLTQKRELQYVSAKMNSVEINGSFYLLQRPSSYRAWYEQTGDDFVFSVKGPRYITHIRSLRDVEKPLTADFIYIRLHGAEEIYTSGYTPEALDYWAARIRKWAKGTEPKDAARVGPPAKPRARGRDVYVYFDNDRKVRAPFDAMELARRLSSRS